VWLAVQVFKKQQKKRSEQFFDNKLSDLLLSYQKQSLASKINRQAAYLITQKNENP
jgi:hypothetical protein